MTNFTNYLMKAVLGEEVVYYIVDVDHQPNRIAHPLYVERCKQNTIETLGLAARGFSASVIAAWRDDTLHSTFEKAVADLASGKKWLPNYQSEIEATVRVLAPAIDIVEKGLVVNLK